MARSFIEGLPCAGKSLLTKELAANGHHVVHELGRVIPSNEFPGNGATVDEVLRIDDWFIDEEQDRMAKNEGFFDRSYITHMTYAYAYGRYADIPSFKSTIAKYKDAIDSSRLPLPDKIVYIEESSEESIRRQTQRVALGHRALDRFWYSKDFLDDTKRGYDEILNSLSGIDIVSIPAILSTEEKYLLALDDHPNLALSKSINLGRYVTSLENI